VEGGRERGPAAGRIGHRAWRPGERARGPSGRPGETAHRETRLDVDPTAHTTIYVCSVGIGARYRMSDDDSQDADDAPDGLDHGHGFSALVGLEVTERGDGRSQTALEVTDELRNPYGAVHGAAVYALADTGMGAALVPGVDEGERVATIEIKISYLRPVFEGTMTCETTVLNRGRSVAYLQSDVENEGRLVAQATGSFSIFER